VRRRAGLARTEIGRTALLFVYAAIILIPCLVVIFGAFKTQKQIFSNPLGFPIPAHTENFTEVWRAHIPRAFRNSLLVVAVSVPVTAFVAALTAFAVTRQRGWRSWVLFGFFTLGLAIPAQVTSIQQYTLFRDLRLTNSLWGLMVANIAVTIPVSVFILAGFMKTLPRELFEAAIVDGASEWKVFTRIVLPLSLPSLGAVVIFLLVIHWNDLLYPLLLVNNEEWWTLPRQLVGLRGEYLTSYPVLFAGVLVASAPIVAAYVFLQRWFIAGMTQGAVKG
jgi:raffinose/stachyose/melibiose transport system permease protein